MPLPEFKTGAQVAKTPAEVLALCGNGTVRLVTCENGRVIGGIGNVGLVEHAGDTVDLEQFVAEVKAKHEALKVLAADPASTNPRANLFTFTVI